MKFLSTAFATLLCVALGACSGSQPPAAAHATPVAVAVATSGPDQPSLQLHGVIASRDEPRLAFKVGGVIARIGVESGESVRAGQLLAELEPTEIDAQQSQAGELDAKAARDLERGEKLYADEVLSLEQLQNLRTQRELAAAQLRTARFNRQHARIVAPADGVVLSRLASAHELVGAGQPVLQVSSGQRGYVLRAAVADRELLPLRIGLPAQVWLDAAPDVPLAGTISELARAADPATGLFAVEITLAPTGLRLASGMVASARLQPAGAARLVRIPAGALVTGEGTGGTVYIYAGGQAHRRAVSIAFIDGAELTLRAGVRLGEQVITDGAAYLDDGEQVAIAQAGAAPAGKR
jgi:membrane fusion protein, multidrug efflux system